jgi:hypothetical protein
LSPGSTAVSRVKSIVAFSLPVGPTTALKLGTQFQLTE